MKIFDLKKFRGSRGMNQEDFAKKIQRSQTTVSRIEKGTIDINDKFLDAVAKGFDVDLEEYKSYNQQGESTLPNSLKDNNHLTPPRHSSLDIETKYQQLLEEKAKLDEKYFDLLERYTMLESSLIKENNDLLKRIDQNVMAIIKTH